MRAQKRRVLVACGLLNQTSQPNREPTHPGLPQNSHAWTPRELANDRPHDTDNILIHRLLHPKNAEPRSKGGAERARAPAMAFTNSTASWLHLPLVSRATTTNLQRSPATSSWYFRSLSRRARCKTAPLVCAAPAQAMPWAVNGLRRVTSIANCAPWYKWKSAGQHFNRPFIHSGDSHVHVTQFRVAPNGSTCLTTHAS